MLEGQELKEAVLNSLESETAPAAAETPEAVSSPEVKTETPAPAPTEAPARTDNVDAAKLQEQINNLNIALKQERESYKGSQSTIDALKEQLKSSAETLERMKQVFSPEPERKQEPEPQAQYLTADQLESFLAKKEEERRAEEAKKSYAEQIKTEIQTLETTWDGKDGKPVYDDEKVMEWQDKNSKLHLTPSEAFYEMNRNAIIDWEIKQRLDKRPDVQNVERPGAAPSGRDISTPGKPATDAELRDLVSAAIEAAMVDTNN